MWTSDRAPRSAPRRGHAVALAMAALCGAAAAAGAQPSVARLGGGLAFGTVLPGTAPVIVAPWSVDAAAERTATVFEITGEPGATVSVRFPLLPAAIENGAGGGTLTVTGWTAQFNTVNGPGGAVSFTPSATPVALTLNASGKGWVSLGATVSASAAQPRGAYALAGGGAIEVQ